MKNVLACVLAIAILVAVGSAFADASAKPYHWGDNGKHWDDLSWWGKSGATPDPVKDAKLNAYWWWPRKAASNADDKELWGNRGKVLHNVYAKQVAPPPAPPVKVQRQKPVANNVLFDFDKAVLKPEGKAETDKMVSSLKQHPKDTALLKGYTDSIGSDQYNLGLGQRRADAVKKYMVEQGVATDRITTKSFGEGDPAVPNDTPANRKLNRRVVFDVTVVGD